MIDFSFFLGGDRLNAENGGLWNGTQQDLNKMVDKVKFWGAKRSSRCRKWGAKSRHIPTDSQMASNAEIFPFNDVIMGCFHDHNAVANHDDWEWWFIIVGFISVYCLIYVVQYELITRRLRPEALVLWYVPPATTHTINALWLIPVTIQGMTSSCVSLQLTWLPQEVERSDFILVTNLNKYNNEKGKVE